MFGNKGNLFYIELLTLQTNSWCSKGRTSWAFPSKRICHTMKKCAQTNIPKDLSKFFNDMMSMVFLHFSNNHWKYFHDFLNSCHINVSFFLETEKENKLSFFDFEFICKQGKFTATFYWKSTFSGAYCNFGSFSVLAWSVLFILFINFSL